MYKKAYTKITKLEENQRGIERTEVAFKCSDLMKEGKAIWQQPFDGSKDDTFRLPYDLGTGKKFYGYPLMGLISQKLYDNKDAKFIPLRYITSKDAQNKGFHIKDGAQPILLENYSKYDMGYTKEKTRTNKTYDKFYKNQTDKYHTYKKAVYCETDFKDEHKFIYPDNNIDAIAYIKNVASNLNLKITEDKHTQKSFYLTAKDEIHMCTKDKYPDERAYYSDLLRNLIKASTRPGRMNAKGTEGYGKGPRDVRSVKDKFRIEFTYMQICLGLKLPYKPSMSLLENKQIAGLITAYPDYLVYMSNQSYMLMSYVNKQSVYRAKNLTEFIDYQLKQGKTDMEIKNLCIAYKFKEIRDLPDIKQRAILNKHLKELKGNSITR